MNLKFCADAQPNLWGIIDTTIAPNLLFYSYIPIVIISIFFGIFIFTKDSKNLKNKLLLSLTSVFSLWILNILLQWIASPISIVHFSWQISAIIEIFIPILTIYLGYVLMTDKDLPYTLKVLFSLLIIAVSILTPTQYNIEYFDFVNCQSVIGPLLGLIYSFEIASIFILWFLAFREKLFSKSGADGIKKTVIILLGTSFLLSIFAASNLIGEFTQDYQFNLIGPIGMVLFIGLLTFLIIRFQTFHVRLFGAQALVIGLVTLIGSKLFTAEVGVNKNITFVTLGFVCIFGYYLIKSVKKEIETRERIEKLAGELDRAAHTLHEANEGQKNLIHIMNHQIKGYLAVGRNIFAELATGDYGQVAEEAKPLLTKGFDEMTDGVEYVQSVLRGESAKSGTLPFDMKPMNLKPVIESLISKQKDVAEKKGLSFESTVADGKYNIIGDATQLEEAFKNLFTNAIKYNTPNGSIKMTLSETDGKILFTIKDTGIGISEEDQKNLFKPGGMGKNSIKYNTDAAGYGLAFVKPVIEAHKGGKIWYETEVGKGTTFFVELPVELVNV